MVRQLKYLNSKGALLDENQLQIYFEKMASDHILQKESSKKTFPIPRLKENFKQITKTYELLNAHLKVGISIHPAGEWLLDNYYVIEETYKTILKELSLKKYQHLIGLSNEDFKGFARVYVIASQMIAHTEGNLDAQKLKALLKAYQNKKVLAMEEIWNIGLFMNIALMEQIRDVCEKIYFCQIQKYKVESIIERLVEKKETLQFEYSPKMHHTKLPFSQEPFVEYLSYRLNQYGKKSMPYVAILEEQVEKTGTTITEVIKKEHFDVAIKKIRIGNCIKSMKGLQRVNLAEIFEEVNGVEKILRNDPMQVYSQMTQETKEYYRNQVKQLSQKTKVSELYIASKALELAKKNTADDKKSHIGYYIVDKGLLQLKKELGLKIHDRDYPEKKARMYVSSLIILTSIISLVNSLVFFYVTQNQILAILFLVVSYIPISEIIIKIMQYMLSKIVKVKRIPKLDFSKGIPKEATTMVIMPTILTSGKTTELLLEKLEVYYLANQSQNLYFTLLGDCTTSSREKEDVDREIVEAGIRKIQELNHQYAKEKPIFYFIYRKRIWNSKENSYLGWERKRGLIYEYNNFLLGKKENTFQYNSWEDNPIPEIQYIITLDSDTNLVLESAQKLIGAMAHPLNQPIIDSNRNVVVEGYGILQPRIGIDIISSRKTLFTKIYAGMGGTDAYANAISDVYQDNFGEGSFTGKGIYHLKAFHQVLDNAIPENTVLSHDLLEGIYARCGLLTDVILLDSYPTKWNSYLTRLSRWTRGDWQIIEWLNQNRKDAKRKKIPNPIGELGKFKILDNLRRSLLEITQVICLCLLLLVENQKYSLGPFYSIVLVSIFIDMLIDFGNTIVFKKEGVRKQSSFENKLPGLRLSVVRALVNFSSIVYRGVILSKAVGVTLYRVYKSRKHLLEWVTAEEAEKNSQENLGCFLKQMWLNILAGAILCIFFMDKRWVFFIGVLWIISPIICWKISKKMQKESQWVQLSYQEQEEMKDIAKHTWQFFEDFLKKENHYLPTDNYQEGRIPVIVERTSSTNIGLAMLSIISAYDLHFINLDKAIFLLQKMIETIQILPKWNGHLYNWYHIKTLQPLKPAYVSTVDSGNFIGYLMVVKVFLEEIQQEELKEKYQIDIQLDCINDFIQKTDFSKLYHEQVGLFSIGFSIEENKLTDSYYDLLASEARQASLVAIAKKDIPAKHWNRLSRVLTTLDGKKGLVSWSGTAFEYWMPHVIIQNYQGSLLEESGQFMFMLQKKYCDKLNIPWGISEAAFYLKDLNENYQYKAFGIPWLGLKRGLSDEIVVSSYGSVLAIAKNAKEAVKNIKVLKQYGMYGKYGLYESIDFTPEHLRKNKKYEVVKTYMAHHQGLILLSINNLINENILPKRFHQNAVIRAVDILLQERLPEDVIYTKEKKEKIEKIKYTAPAMNYNEQLTNEQGQVARGNVLSNEHYLTFMQTDGTGFSQYDHHFIYRYKKTETAKQGVGIYFKNLKNGRVWSSYYQEAIPDYKVIFTADKNEIKMRNGDIGVKIKTFILANQNLEVRHIEIENLSKEEQILEVSTALEPVLSKASQDYAHKAFNNLFLRYEEIENGLFVQRNKRGEEEDICMAVGFYSQKGEHENFEYEIDKEKLCGRLEEGIPSKIKNSEKFSSQIGLVVDPMVCFRRTAKLEAYEKKEWNFLISVAHQKEEAMEQMETYKSFENTKRGFEIVKIRNEETARYLQMTGQEMLQYQKLLSFLLLFNPLKTKQISSIEKRAWNQEDLWAYGISGDDPILLVSVSEISNLHMIAELLKAYQFFQNKNIRVDMVILENEKSAHEYDVIKDVRKMIVDYNLAYCLQNGIYLLQVKNKQKQDVLFMKANLILEAQNGTLSNCLAELEENISYHEIKETPICLQEEMDFDKPKIAQMDLRYANSYGGFQQDGREYCICVDEKVPSVWSNILANQYFGTVITQNLGGYTWYRNSRLNRITKWSNNTIEDTPSEELYIQDITEKKFWKIGKGNLLVTHGRGYSKFEQNKQDIKQKLEVFVSKNDPVKINRLHIQNNTNHAKIFNILYKVDLVLDEDEIKSEGNIHTEYRPKEDLLYAQNLFLSGIKTVSYVYSSEKIESYTGDQASFHPAHLEKLNKNDSLGHRPCMAIQVSVDLKALEEKEIIFVLGACEEKEKWNLKYRNQEVCKTEYMEIKKYWETLLEKIKVKTPEESFNVMLNGWTMYQTISSRLYAKSGFHQSGGAWGFRDQLQDVLGLLFLDKGKVKEQILMHASHQFIEGDVEHWWHEETERGIRTRFSDDRLWLPYVVAKYIQHTGDEDILETEVAYREGTRLENEQSEKYEKHPLSSKKDTVYQHCIKAIGISLSMGENGLPFIGSGDWNDGFSLVGNQGKGESVWLGFFLYAILEQWIPILRKKEETELLQQYETQKELLKKALNRNGWDGRWYRRAFTDEGNLLGSVENEECRIDSISQSWSVISNAGENDKKYMAMESLEKYLIFPEVGIIKLLDPPFEKSSFNPGYIKSYLPGVRENGGQYTHEYCSCGQFLANMLEI